MLHSHLHDVSKYSQQLGCLSEPLGQESMERCVSVPTSTGNRGLSSCLADSDHLRHTLQYLLQLPRRPARRFLVCLHLLLPGANLCGGSQPVRALDGRQQGRLDRTYGGSQPPKSCASSSELFMQHTYTAHIITPSYQLSTAPRLYAVPLSEKLLPTSTVGILGAPSFVGIPLGHRQPSRMKTGAL